MARELSRSHATAISGIYAHIDAGKTTCSERILFYTGKSHQHRRSARRRCNDGLDGAGAGNAVLQLPPLRQQLSGSARIARRGRNIDTKYRMNIIDTPGHVDFTMKLSVSLAVLDGAVAVLDANAGVEPQTENRLASGPTATRFRGSFFV